MTIFSLIYFGIVSLVSTIYAIFGLMMKIPDQHGLWKIEIITRCLLHWLGLIGSIGLIIKKTWANKTILLSSASIGFFTILVMAIQFFLFWRASRYSNIIQVFSGTIMININQIVTLLIVTTIFFHFKKHPIKVPQYRSTE